MPSKLPNGTTRLSGFGVIVFPVVASWFGYDVSYLFYESFGDFTNDLFVIVGSIVMLVGVVLAEGPLWFSKKDTN